ncbi:hypothetical protein [Streptomyces sp. NPDC088727]|uniref:hypothetical protein n=1 Tax=Streptomyces sp. NPDC088727 TaxID=3365875 RepID=UPI0038116F8E
MNACRHAPHLRDEGRQIDTGLLQADELTGHGRPVRALHQVTEDVLGQDRAQLVGAEAGSELLGFRYGVALGHRLPPRIRRVLIRVRGGRHLPGGTTGPAVRCDQNSREKRRIEHPGDATLSE